MVQPPKVEPHHLPLGIAIIAGLGLFIGFNINLIASTKNYDGPPILNHAAFCSAPVISTASESADTCRVRISTDAARCLPLNAGIVHVIVNDDSCQIARPYTPISYDSNHIELLVRRYETGTVSKHIYSLNEGDTLRIRGPLESFPYKINCVKHVSMIAGGTGIAPMYQLMTKILSSPNDKTSIQLIYASKDNQNILLKKELDQLLKSYPDQLRIKYLVDRANEPLTPDVQVGFMDEKQLETVLPHTNTKYPFKILVCGPDGMIRSIAGPKLSEEKQGPVGGILKHMGYNDTQVFKL
ncbi:hypothetical protein O5D80_001770 [Batrachochytrium dendrobatidis]|nr:hypothetical protein O5D80_001770 [Batrachochytrium dendrobatidis]